MATRKGKYPQLADRDWLYEQYVTLGKSCPQIAAELGGATNGAVEYRLHQFEIPVRGRHYGHWNEKTCERCGESFTPSGPAQRFCSAVCREDKIAWAREFLAQYGYAVIDPIPSA